MALLRLVHLISVARLRGLGFAPWCFLFAWLLWSVQQEPTVLRTHGIYLTEGAAWWGFGLLLFAALAEGWTDGWTERAGLLALLSANWLALLGLGCALGGTLWLADWLSNSLQRSAYFGVVLHFVAGSAGLVAVLAAPARMTQHSCYLMVVFGFVIVFTALVQAPLGAKSLASAALAALAGHAFAASYYCRAKT